MADDATLVLDRTSQLLDELDPKAAARRSFRARQFDLGLAWVSFPEGSAGSASHPTSSARSTGAWPRPGPPRPAPGTSSA